MAFLKGCMGKFLNSISIGFGGGLLNHQFMSFAEVLSYSKSMAEEEPIDIPSFCV